MNRSGTILAVPPFAAIHLPAALTGALDRTSVVAAFAVIALNLVDGFGTLHHLEYGARELNPVMAYLLGFGPVAFLAGKHALASLGIVGILVNRGSHTARSALLYVLLPIYVLVAGYQIALFAWV